MIKRPPLPLGRLLHVVFLITQSVLPVARGPRTRVMVVLNGTELLMVKNWLGSQQWTLPGGGIKRGESPEMAALRELTEETGLVLNREQLRFVGPMQNPRPPRSILLYRIDITDADSAAHIPPQSRFEIVGLSWHPILGLPIDRTEVVDLALSQQ
jgi:8-oxo-dGTP pyrophosphatase MutT (NUDIX family)